MPLTPAEKQRKYREKLKNENPEKYNDMKKRNAERTKQNRKRIAECDEDEIDKMRKQWREEKRRKLKANLVVLPESEKILPGNNNVQPETERNVPDRENNNTDEPEDDQKLPDSENNNNALPEIEKNISESEKASINNIKPPLENLRFRFKKILPPEAPKPRTDSENKSRYNAIYYENLTLKQQLTLEKKRVKVLQKKVNRYGKKIQSLKETIKKLEGKNNSQTTITTEDNIEEMTPLSKTNSYVQNNLPDIPESQKESVKRQLFEHNVLVSALKNKYRESKTVEKNVLKDVIESETTKKYKLKSKFSRYLGLKANIRRASHTIKKRRMNLLNSLYHFYNRDDVSRMTSGKKEYKTFKKRQVQRRYLLQPLESLYEKYKSENGKLSYTTFKKHRPFFVLPPKIMNRDTCACSKHENLEMKLKKLHGMNLITHKCLKKLPSKMMCEVNSKDCAYNKCSVCQDKTIEFKMENVNLKDVVTWKEWIIKNKEYNDKKTNTVKKTKMIVKQTKTGTVKDLISDFTKESIVFKKHWYNIRHQFKMHQRCLNMLDEESVAIHMDFSENYTCKLATEVQAMHFGASKVQFTLHTGMLYTKEDEDPLSFATISPNNYHGPEAVWAHLDPILTLVRSKYPKVNAIHFFSDGPTSQYRNKKNFYLFLENTKKLGFPHSTWNYSEASHGKGPADGVGGAIKRSLDAKVKYGVDIPDAQTAFNVLSQKDSEIMLFFVPESAITEKSYDLRPIPGTMAIHQIRNTPIKNVIAYRELSCFCSNLKGYCECLGIKQYNLKPTSALKEKKEITPLKATKKQKEDSDYDSTEKFSIHDSSDENGFEEWREDMLKMDDNNKDYIQYADTENSAHNKDCNNIKNDLQEGDFVIFKYEKNLYPGCVLSMNEEALLISAMKRALKSWKWPEKPDELLYPWEDVVVKINTPKQISKRGYFSVPEIDSID